MSTIIQPDANGTNLVKITDGQESICITLAALISTKEFYSRYITVSFPPEFRGIVSLTTHDDEYNDWLKSVAAQGAIDVVNELRQTAERLGLHETFEMIMEEAVRE